MNSSKQWYAVYTRPRGEKKVAELLTRKNLEAYCPLNKVIRQWSDRKKLVLEPLFTSYVFVKIFEQQQSILKQTEGVINMVYWLGKPAVIREEEIDIIRRFLNEYQNIKLEKTPVNVNDIVKIVSGPLMEHEGKVVGVKNKSVKIILPSLGFMMIAEVEITNVERISEKNYFYEIPVEIISIPQ